jgi:hypothetical protein
VDRPQSLSSRVHDPEPGHGAAGPSPRLADPVRAFVAVGLAFFTISTLYLAAGVLVPVVGAIVVWFVLNAMANGVRRLPVIGSRLSWGGARCCSPRSPRSSWDSSSSRTRSRR